MRPESFLKSLLKLWEFFLNLRLLLGLLCDFQVLLSNYLLCKFKLRFDSVIIRMLLFWFNLALHAHIAHLYISQTNCVSCIRSLICRRPICRSKTSNSQLEWIVWILRILFEGFCLRLRVNNFLFDLLYLLFCIRLNRLEDIEIVGRCALNILKYFLSKPWNKSGLEVFLLRLALLQQSTLLLQLRNLLGHVFAVIRNLFEIAPQTLDDLIFLLYF